MKTLLLSASIVAIGACGPNRAVDIDEDASLTDVPGDHAADATRADTGPDVQESEDASAPDAAVDATEDAALPAEDAASPDASVIDSATDAPVTDSATDAPVTDSGTDAAVIDSATDAAVTDSATDAALPDSGTDAALPDSGGTVGTCSLALQATLTAPANVGESVFASGFLGTGPSRIASIPRCPSATMNTPGEDHVYALNVTEAGTYEMTARGEYVPAIAVRPGDCLDTSMQLACNRINTGSPSYTLVTVTLEPGPYYLVLDRVTTLASSYTLTVTRR